MQILVYLGLAMALAGLAGVIWCIRRAAWLKKTELDGQQTRAALNTLILAHMASIGGAFLGIGLMVAGMLLS